MGKVMVPMQALMIGAAIKVVLTYVLTAIPAIGIRGAALGTVIGFAVAALYNICNVAKNIGWKWFDPSYHLIKPVLSVAAMGIVVKVIYALCLLVTKSNGVSTLAAIAVGGCSYFIVLLAIGGIRTEDIRKMPKVGNRLADLLVKMKLARD